MNSTKLLTGVIVMVLSASVGAADKEEKTPAALAFKMKSLAGKEVDLKQYQGKVLLVVNVASQCGATGQYEQMQALHQKYSKDGLVVLGFPCNQFGAQEPGSEDEISQFCKKNYGVAFDMFSKVDVNDQNAAPFFKYLTAQAAKPKGAGPISWNFEKFLIDRKGNVIARFETDAAPDAPEIVQLIEQNLKK